MGESIKIENAISLKIISHIARLNEIESDVKLFINKLNKENNQHAKTSLVNANYFLGIAIKRLNEIISKYHKLENADGTEARSW